MILIERYIFNRVFALTMITLASTTVIVLVTQVLNRVNLLVDSGQTSATVLKLALFLTPSMVVVILPFALLVAVMRILNTMNADSEVAIIEAAGGSRSVLAKPVLTLSAMLTVACLLISQFLEPWTNKNIRDLVDEASSDIIQIAIRSGAFKQVESGLFIQVSEQLPGGQLGGIFIADTRDKQTEIIHYARRGSILETGDVNLLLLHDGEIQNKNVKSGDISVIGFSSYALDLATFGPKIGGSFYIPRQRSTAYLLSPDPGDYFVMNRPDQIRVELNRRFSDWLYPLAFGLIAVFFAGTARSNRDERLWGLGVAAFVALAVRGAGFIVLSASGNSALATLLVFTVPLATIAAFALLLVFGRMSKTSRTLADRTLLVIERAQGWIANRRLKPSFLSGGRAT